MPAPANDIVKVTARLGTARIATADFGKTLLLTETSVFGTRTKMYGSVDEMLEDGFLSTHEAVKKAQVFFSQERTPENIIVGRRLKNVNEVQRISYASGSEGGYKLNIGGQVLAEAIQHTATIGEIETAIETLDNVTACTVAGDPYNYTITFTDPVNTSFGKIEVVDNDFDINVKVEAWGSAEDADVATTMTAIYDDTDFFGLLTTSHITDEEAEEIAEIVQSKECIFVRLTVDSDVLNPSNTDNIAVNLKDKSISKTAVVFTKTVTESGAPDNHIDAGILGLQLTKVPGSSTFKFRNLVGVVNDSYTTAERNHLRDINVNFFESQNGRNIFKEGTVAVGEFIDIIIGMDYLNVRIMENATQMLMSAEKIGFDELGLVEANINGTGFQHGELTRLLVAGSFQTILPTNLDPNDLMARKLKGVKYRGKLAGAVHFIYVEGILDI